MQPYKHDIRLLIERAYTYSLSPTYVRSTSSFRINITFEVSILLPDSINLKRRKFFVRVARILLAEEVCYRRVIS